MLRAMLVMVGLMGCAGSFGKVNRHVGRAALITSTLALVCDGMQTLQLAGNGWMDSRGRPREDANPIMGETPSVATVSAYFLGAVVINSAVWALTPERYRAAIPVTLTATQTAQIVHNANRETSVCGF